MYLAIARHVDPTYSWSQAHLSHFTLWFDQIWTLCEKTQVQKQINISTDIQAYARTHTHMPTHVVWICLPLLYPFPVHCILCFLYKPENCNHIPVWRVTEHEKILVCVDWRVQIKTIYEPKSSKFFTWRCTLLSYKGQLLTLLSLQQ